MRIPNAWGRGFPTIAKAARRKSSWAAARRACRGRRGERKKVPEKAFLALTPSFALCNRIASPTNTFGVVQCDVRSPVKLPRSSHVGPVGATRGWDFVSGGLPGLSFGVGRAGLGKKRQNRSFPEARRGGEVYPVFSGWPPKAFAGPPVFSGWPSKAFAGPPVFSGWPSKAFAGPPVFSGWPSKAFARPPAFCGGPRKVLRTRSEFSTLATGHLLAGWLCK